jgi:hypothetical protein
MKKIVGLLGFSLLVTAAQASECINVPYDPANFWATSGTWTVAQDGVTTFCYRMLDGDKAMLLHFSFESSRVSTAVAELMFKIPNGRKAARETYNTFSYYDNYAADKSVHIGMAGVTSTGDDFIQLRRAEGRNWSASGGGTTRVTGGTYVFGQIELELQ